MNSFEQSESNKETDKIKAINLDKGTRDFVDIDKDDVGKVNKEINNILGIESLDDESIEYQVYSNKEEFKKASPNHNSNAAFFINPETQEETVFTYRPIPSSEEIVEARSYNHSLEGMKQSAKLDILSSFAHEKTHMHPFFKKHGNDDATNMWEQELICTYVGEKTRGDISDNLFKKGLLSEEIIDSFSLANGEWNQEEGKNIATNYFYPFLVKEYGIDKVRDIWKITQEDPNIEKAIESILKEDPEKVVGNFKEKIKNREYLKNIFN